ncbi:MAG TPA: hypothetical protein VGM88_00715 [Kofleriaceae bacterium]|jgi:hypothetical protein
MPKHEQFAWIGLLILAACGGGDDGGGNGDDGGSTDPTAIDVFVLSGGAPTSGRSVMLLASDGTSQGLITDDTGHAVAHLTNNTGTATVYTTDDNFGSYVTQGVTPGEHVCMDCDFSTTDCGGMPRVTNLTKTSQGYVWQIDGSGSYAGISISWAGHTHASDGHFLAPPGTTSASTGGSSNVTVSLLSRDDATTYAELVTLSSREWAATPLCASSAMH